MILKQHVVHLPEVALRACCLSGFGSKVSVFVNAGVRVMTKDQSKAGVEFVVQFLQGSKDSSAVRAFVVSVFDESQSCAGWTANVVPIEDFVKFCQCGHGGFEIGLFDVKGKFDSTESN